MKAYALNTNNNNLFSLKTLQANINLQQRPLLGSYLHICVVRSVWERVRSRLWIQTLAEVPEHQVSIIISSHQSTTVVYSFKTWICCVLFVVAVRHHSDSKYSLRVLRAFKPSLDCASLSQQMFWLPKILTDKEEKYQRTWKEKEKVKQEDT